MLTQAETVVCKQGFLTLDQLTKVLSAHGDTFLQKVADAPVVQQLTEFLFNLPGSEVIRGDKFDSFAMFVGQGHSHLVSFLKGCHVFSVDLGDVYTETVLKIMGLIV